MRIPVKNALGGCHALHVFEDFEDVDNDAAYVTNEEEREHLDFVAEHEFTRSDDSLHRTTR